MTAKPEPEVTIRPLPGVRITGKPEDCEAMARSIRDGLIEGAGLLARTETGKEAKAS